MGLIAPIAALLGLEAGSLVDRARTTAITLGLIIVFGMVAAGFLLAAIFMALADLYSPIISALILAGIFLLLAGGVYLSMKAGDARRRREVAERRKTTQTGSLLTTAAFSALPMLVRAPLLIKIGLPAAAAAFAILRASDDED
jgi:hypothetical protein